MELIEASNPHTQKAERGKDMEFTVTQAPLRREKADALILPLFQDEDFDRLRLQKALREHVRSVAIDTHDFAGKKKEVFYLPAPRAFANLRRIFLVGLGKQEAYDQQVLREGIASVMRALKKYSVEKALLLARPVLVPGRNWMQFGQIVAEATRLGRYEFEEYKGSAEEDEISRKKRKELTRVAIAGAQASQQEALKAGFKKGEILAEAAIYTRNLCNQPPNVMNPGRMAAEAEALAAEFDVDCEILETRDLEDLQMNALLAVGKGSTQQPRLIILKYSKGPKGMKPIALVGKGVTFDSGGISLKPSKNMDEMKFDMSGGAVVLGVIRAVAALNLPVNVVAAIPAVENLPDGNASKPGDIVKAMNGKTIEILNTDAEGRLILADALSYIEKEYDPGVIVDLATLTGAVVVALGSAAAGIMGNDDGLIEDLRRFGDNAGERLWPLPLYDDYREQIKSDVADIKNIGGGPAGVTVGGAFLSHFIEEGRRWAHIDIAGVAWTTKDTPLAKKGATGFGVRLLAEWLSAQVKKN